MAKLGVTPVLNKFNRQIKRSLDLIGTVTSISDTSPSSLSQNKIYMIFELSFLKIFLAWEQFLEDSFIRYMLGGKTGTGYAPKKYVTPRNLKHAFDLVKGGKDYADWTSPDIVIKKAKLFFKDGEPYKDVLHSIITDITEMKTIRNAVVHMSTDSNEKFKTLIRSKLLGYAPRKITPGKFLSLTISGKNLTYIEDYKNKLITASSLIVK